MSSIHKPHFITAGLNHLLPSLLCAFSFVGYAGAEPPGALADPRQAAQAFYDTLRFYHVSGLPQGNAWRALEPRMTSQLAGLIRTAQRQQAAFIKNNPGEKPPWIEGDLFSSLFERPQKHTIGEARAARDRAEVPIHFAYTERGGNVYWTDTLVLRQTPRGWLVEDLRYGGSWPFASKGSLVKALSSGD